MTRKNKNQPALLPDQGQPSEPEAGAIAELQEVKPVVTEAAIKGAIAEAQDKKKKREAAAKPQGQRAVLDAQLEKYLAERVTSEVDKALGVTTKQLETVISTVAQVAQPKLPLIFQAMRSVMADIAPLAKGHENEEGGFWFRKIDEIVAELQPLFVKHGVLVAPEALERFRESRPDVEGQAQIWTIARTRWRFFSAFDGSMFPPEGAPCIVDGEGMSDMSFSTNAAQTMSFKQALTQVFAIPVHGEDPEAYIGNKSRYVAPETAFQEPRPVSTSDAIQPSLLPDAERETASKGRRRTSRPRNGEESSTSTAAEGNGASSSSALDQPTGPSGGPLSPGMVKILDSTIVRFKRSWDEVFQHFGVTHEGELQMSQMAEINAWIAEPTQQHLTPLEAAQ